jgi:hypothetical protein
VFHFPFLFPADKAEEKNQKVHICFQLQNMWKLKIAEGGPWLESGNSHIGREIWEFDPNFGSDEERDDVKSAQEQFQKNRFRTRHSSDILARMQV